MKNYARIEGTTVVELFQTADDISTLFHPDLVWVDCTAHPDVKVGWTYFGGAFEAPAGPSLAKQKSDKSASIKAALSYIDAKGARGSREVALALAAGTAPDPVTVTTLSGYEAQAVTLRAKLDAIDAATAQAELDAVVL